MNAIYAFMILSIIFCVISFYLDKKEIDTPKNSITDVVDNYNFLKNGGFEQNVRYWGTGYYEANKYKKKLLKNKMTQAFYLSEK